MFLIAPWFFMDLKGKEAGETEALERRNAALRRIAFVKGCNEPTPIVTHQRKTENGRESEIAPRITTNRVDHGLNNPHHLELPPSKEYNPYLSKIIDQIDQKVVEKHFNT